MQLSEHEKGLMRLYYQQNKEKIKAANKRWAKAHPDRRREIARESYRRKKGLTSDEFRI